MSKVAIQGNASGTGTFTIAAPNSNTDRTLTLPDEAGTVLTSASDITSQAMNGPAFSAYRSSSAQSISSSTWTKLEFQTEEFDTDNCYDNATNYRFTPNVAGYYQVNGGTRADPGLSQYHISIYKNGNEFKRIGFEESGRGDYGSALIHLNGTTDYIELYGLHTFGSAKNIAFTGSEVSYFQACLVRSA